MWLIDHDHMKRLLFECFAVAITEMGDAKSCKWTCPFIVLLSLLILVDQKVNAENVPMTFLSNAAAKGAVCLDGSPPAYHFQPGSGSGANNWVIQMEGGGWCTSEADCLDRTHNFRGSSTKMGPISFAGILSSQQKLNPDFYNWNRIKVRYCDGSSFTGDVEAVDPKTKIYYRGGRVWLAIIEELLAKGMSKAQNAILSGCSAGGLAAILHCDKFRDLLPGSATVKCLSNAGYFINAKDISGTEHIKDYFSQVVALHGSAKNLPSSCTSKYPASLCFFPQYVVESQRTPLFILNSAYDAWQIRNILAPKSADLGNSWSGCKVDIKKCSASQLSTLQGYRSQFLSALPSGGSSMFITGCHAHCQGGDTATWSGNGPLIDNTKISKAVGDWYYSRSSVHLVDCAYPCNPTCPKVSSED